MKRTLKNTVLFALALAAAAMLFYFILLAINWKDQAPSPAAVFFQGKREEGVSISDSDNAYLHLIGVEASPEETPYELGVAWIQWAQQPLADRFSSAEPTLNPTPISDPLQQLLDTCGTPGEDCQTQLEASTDQLAERLAAETLRLERYRAIHELPYWHEYQLLDVQSPFPNYQSWLELARLSRIQAWLRAKEGHAEEAQTVLNADTRFWRFALEEADSIISKMIALAALRQNIQWSNILSRDFGVPLPSAWHEPVSDEERSMKNAFAGEYHLSLAAGIHHDEDSFNPLARALQPLFQPQSTSNQQAEQLLNAARATEGVTDALPAQINTYRLQRGRLLDQAGKWSLYNPIGHILWQVSARADYVGYGTRVTDLEGMRRALIVTGSLRAAGVQPMEVERHLAQHELTNPYSGEPLLWNADAGAIVFEGLAPGPNQLFSLPY